MLARSKRYHYYQGRYFSLPVYWHQDPPGRATGATGLGCPRSIISRSSSLSRLRRCRELVSSGPSASLSLAPSISILIRLSSLRPHSFPSPPRNAIPPNTGRSSGFGACHIVRTFEYSHTHRRHILPIQSIPSRPSVGPRSGPAISVRCLELSVAVRSDQVRSGQTRSSQAGRSGLKGDRKVP